MDLIGVMIRKWDYRNNGVYYNPSRKNLDKQMKTLHKKLKKGNNVITEYSIEKDKYDNKYHTHMMIRCDDSIKVLERLQTFVGGQQWIKRDVGINVFNECNGRFGLVHTETVIDEKLYRNYIDKQQQITTLF